MAEVQLLAVAHVRVAELLGARTIDVSHEAVEVEIVRPRGETEHGQVRVRMRFVGREVPGEERFRGHDVVAHDRDKRGVGLRHREIAGPARPAVAFEGDRGESEAPRRVGLEQGPGVVGGRIVDDDQLEGEVSRLRLVGSEHAGEKRRPVVGRHDHADRRLQARLPRNELRRSRRRELRVTGAFAGAGPSEASRICSISAR
jgi:hypothetical protein